VSTPLLSVVVPVYNEAAVLPLLTARLRPVLDSLHAPYEVVAVDDGSTDATPAVLAGLRYAWPELRIVRLLRNAGHQAALTAGLRCSFGQYVVSLDADLQDPPEKIPEMLALARNQALHVVYGVRADRSADSPVKRGTATAYYHLMRRLVGGYVPLHGGDYRLLSRTAVDTLCSLREHQPVLRLLVPWLGLPSGQVAYTREHRAAGRTKYPALKMAALAWDSVTNFTAAPLRVATALGLTTLVVSGMALVATILSAMVGDTVSGWASLLAAILFLGAVQLICLGLLGEYVGRIYAAVQQRPAYIVAHDSAAAGQDVGAQTPRVLAGVGQ
jgi:polyisoprenyl-phosphate glycosyltransferase